LIGPEQIELESIRHRNLMSSKIWSRRWRW